MDPEEEQFEEGFEFDEIELEGANNQQKPGDEDNNDAEASKGGEPEDEEESSEEEDQTQEDDEEEDTEESEDEGEESSEDGDASLVEDVTGEDGKVQRRDYTGLDPEDVKTLKKLKNHEYARVRPVVDRVYEERRKAAEIEQQLNDSAQGKLPQRWYEHEQAYTLSPQYRQAASTVGLIRREKSHYARELAQAEAAAENGEDATVRSIAGYDQETGQPIYSDPIPFTKEIKREIEGLLYKADSKLEQAQQQAQQARQSWSDVYAQSEQFVDKFMEQAKSKLHKDLIPADDDKDVAAFRQQGIPQIWQAHPLAKLAASMYGVIVRQGDMLRKANSNKTVKQRNELDKKKSTPTKLKSGGSGKAPTKEINFADLDTEMTT